MQPSAHKEALSQAPQPPSEPTVSPVEQVGGEEIDKWQPELVKKIPEATSPSHMEGSQRNDIALDNLYTLMGAKVQTNEQIGDVPIEGALEEPLPDPTSLGDRLQEAMHVLKRLIFDWRKKSFTADHQPLDIVERHAKEHGSDYAKETKALHTPPADPKPQPAAQQPPIKDNLVQFPVPQPQNNIQEVPNKPQTEQPQQKAA